MRTPNSALLVLVLIAPFSDALCASRTQQEQHPGVTTTYDTLTLRDGTKLQTIVTRPERRTDELPAILFVQWLSCDSVAISTNPRDGWSAMLARIVRESGALVWRTEKRGIGGSEGDCASMDYDTELADHREALRELMRRPDVDPQRVVIFGGSIGGTYAPLLAADVDVAGVMVWGAGATTWAERTLKFERNALELGGSDPAKLQQEMSSRLQFLDRYLLQALTPQQIAKEDPTLGATWAKIIGTSADAQYGRPFTFHQQAHRANWAGAWSRVKAPVLVLYGEYDWFESADAASLITRIVNAEAPGAGTLQIVPGMNHHFTIFPTQEAAFKEKEGRVDPGPAVDVMLRWLKELFAQRSGTPR
jgi:pimeloyl-ACP methyl ester carboxylesterase